jgi:hypothetical protein
MSRFLYVLRFIDEDLIKIGITGKITSRLGQLGPRFNLAESYLLAAPDERSLRRIESSIHVIFENYKAIPLVPISSGNSEIFRAEILPKVIDLLQNVSLNVEKGIEARKPRQRGGKQPGAGRPKVGSVLIRFWCKKESIAKLRAEAERRKRPNQKRLEVGRLIDDLVREQINAEQ